MADIASLVLAVDSTQVKTGTASLDGLTAAGTRAEGAIKGVGAASTSAGAAASRMAAQAQMSATAAVGMATGLKSTGMAANNARIAMLDVTHVGINMTQMLASGVNPMRALVMESGRIATAVQYSSGGISGLVKQLAAMTGILKVTQNAELAEEAANASAAAQAVRGAAQRAASNIMAADTELALAQASLRVAATTEAAEAAQARIAAAHEAVAAAAGEAAVAENALAVAQTREAEAAAASSAATRTVIGGTGVGLIGLAIVAGTAFGAFKQLQDQIRDDGTLTAYRDSLGLTHREMLKLTDGVETVGGHIKTLGDVTITFGDLMHGVWQELAREISNPAPWDNLAKNATSAFSGILHAWNIVSAGISAGLMTMQKMAGDALNPGRIRSWSDLNYLAELKKNYGIALAQNNAAFAGVTGGAIGSAEQRMQEQADALKANRTPRKGRHAHERRNAADDELAKLDAQIASEKALAAAYLDSDAAAVKAEADEKAMTLAIEKHANAAQTAALKQKELALAIATGSKEGAKAASNLRFEADTREAVNDMVAAGIIPASQANSELQLETQLRPLAALAAVAQGDALANLVTIMARLTKAHDDLNKQLAREKALKQIADNDNEIERLKLEATLIGKSNRERAIAIAQLEAMQKIQADNITDPAQQAKLLAQAAQKAQLSVQTPFQQWAQTVPGDAKAITESLQGIATKGFDNLASSLTEVIMGTKSLGAAFKDVARSIIADIIQMTIRMLIFKAIQAAMGGAGGFADGGVFVGGKDTASIGGKWAHGGVFSGGNVIPFASGGVVGRPTFFGMSGGRTGLMGEAGPEAIMPLGRDSMGRLGVRANDNRSGPIEVRVVVDTSDDLMVKAAVVADSRIRLAEPRIISNSAKATIRSAGRQPIMGRR